MKINKFNKEYLEFLVPQRTRITTEYSITEQSNIDEICNALTTMMLKDYDMVKSHLLSKVDNILDIGCGLGLIDKALYDHYDGNVNLHLLDKTNSISQDTSVRGFNKEYVFYNSMDATRDVLESNGVESQKLYTYEAEPTALQELNNKKFDIVLSFLSCGWHYSIETYIDLIKNTLNPNGILIIDIRHNTGQLEYALEHFELIETIINTAESKHTGGTIGDRYIFKKK